MLSLVANETDNAVIITNASGLIEYVNQGFERLTGYEMAEVRGKNFTRS
ncbi:PAS domain S-box protein [Marinomonas rhizomae]|uniref:PAS domain S-box-containing protein n=1 Tax=Marinomonas rhizomae TaxID=491948 RepID=A0A366IWT8_9GAMM|nr:PAS domain-containing protein [Marinomonas rhizomae]RBP78295.1 PAS domain S-box-containing protein [Marinomonas rhizomae]RNF69946.1 PAS domain S-box protein [Marinomonas rhizomae]